MNKRSYLLIAIFLSASLFAFSQGKERNDMDPTVTEVWDPIPPKVNVSNGIPSDAIVLFDGSGLSEWTNMKSEAAEWEIMDNAMQVTPGTGGIKTKKSFGDCQLHIEWASPSVVKGEGQGRGNSGIFLQSLYELQVLDSYESRTYANGQASAIYKQAIPLVNACKAPGEWQTYDIIYKAPRFNEDGIKVSNATVTVLHNGILTLNNFEIWGSTQYKGLPSNEAHGDQPLMLQDHSDLVRYRNIWIREL